MSSVHCSKTLNAHEMDLVLDVPLQESPYTVHKIHKLAAKMRNYCVTPSSSPFRWTRQASDPGPHADLQQDPTGVIDPASPTFSPLQPSARQDPRDGMSDLASPVCNPLQLRTNPGSPLTTPGASPLSPPPQTFDPLGSAAKLLEGSSHCESIHEPAASEKPHFQGHSPALQHTRDTTAQSHVVPLPELAADIDGSANGKVASAEGIKQCLGTAPSAAPDSALQPQRLLDRLDAESPGGLNIAAAGASSYLIFPLQ